MKVLDKKIGDVKYTKNEINLPKKFVEESKLKDKETYVEQKKIVIRKK